MNKFLFAALFFVLQFITSTHAQQQFGGIGAMLFLDTIGGHTMPCVQGMVKNSSADQYLKATDFIIKVNGVSCLDKPMDVVIGMIRGEVGTTVKIVVADTKEGKHPREYDLERRAIISSQPGGPPVEPVVAFNAQCESEVLKMKKSGSEIIKTFPTDCGNYFFNFNAEAHQNYHIRIMVLQDKETDVNTPFYLTARVFDNADEAAATELPKYNVKDAGTSGQTDFNGAVTFNKACVATINFALHNDVKKCRAMYIVVYK